MQARLGIAASDDEIGALPLHPSPTEEETRDAVQRLSDPEARMLDEVFWFWPTNGDPESDPALCALSQGKIGEATNLWTHQAREEGKGGVAEHNLAVFRHLVALDYEWWLATEGLDKKDSELLPQLWSQALSHWQAVVGEDGFWRRLRERVRQLNDQKLTTGVARRIRHTLPKALLLIHARIALNALDRGDQESSATHAAILMDSGFADGLGTQVLRQSIKPIRQQIKSLCKDSERQATADPPHANSVTRDLIANSTPLLATVDALLPDNDPIRQGLHDQVATTALSCQIGYGNNTEDWEESLALLEATLPLATGDAVRGRLEDNIEIVKRNLAGSMCWFCGQNSADDKAVLDVKMYGDVTRTPTWNGVQVQWRHGTFSVPRCPRCRSAHTTQGAWTGTCGTIGVLLGFGGCIAGASNDAFGTGFLMLVLGSAIGFGIGAAIGSAQRPQGVKPESAKSEFPAIKELVAEGWTFGEKPNTDQ